MELSQRWADRLHIIQTVAPAIAIAFLIDVILSRPSYPEFFGFVTAYAGLFLVFFLIGRWLGRRTWPKRGKALARWMLARRIRKGKGMLFLSDRPDRTFTRPQRIWEVVGFAAGVSVILSAALSFLGITPSSLLLAGFVLPLLVPIGVTAAAFVLIPYWLFARLGIRIVDPLRWLVLPLSSRYADRWKLSNGVLVLVAAGAVANLAFRAGASGGESVVLAITLILRVIAVVLVIAAPAVAYYVREERRISHEMEDESVAMGIRDGRGMTDGDFLPRLPPNKS